jgi:RNA polymerase sigma-70 factor, ECF subfamily
VSEVEGVPSETLGLLRRWHTGDAAALHDLLLRNLPAIRERLDRRMGRLLRAKLDADDLLQDVCVRILSDGPRFEVADAEHFRMLMARIVENEMRDAHRGFTALRRAAARERELPPTTILAMRAVRAASSTPSRFADRAEREEWVRLALGVVDEETRRLVVLHQWEKKSFVEMAADLGIAEDAARMRYNRAIARVTRAIVELRSGRIEKALDEPPTG